MQSNNPKQIALTGFEEYVAGEPVPEFYEGKPNSNSSNRFFDASVLPDAPGYQDAASGASMCMVYITCPDWNTMNRVVKALTMGTRSLQNPTTKYSTLDCLNPGRTGAPLIEQWEKNLVDNVKVDNNG